MTPARIRFALFWGRSVLRHGGADARREVEKLLGEADVAAQPAVSIYLQAVRGYARNRNDPARAIAWLAIARQTELLIDYELAVSA